ERLHLVVVLVGADGEAIVRLARRIGGDAPPRIALEVEGDEAARAAAAGVAELRQDGRAGGLSPIAGRVRLLRREDASDERGDQVLQPDARVSDSFDEADAGMRDRALAIAAGRADDGGARDLADERDVFSLPAEGEREALPRLDHAVVF